jgi:hypothetical protein
MDTKAARSDTTIERMRYLAASIGLLGTLVLIAPFH